MYISSKFNSQLSFNWHLNLSKVCAISRKLTSAWKELDIHIHNTSCTLLHRVLRASCIFDSSHTTRGCPFQTIFTPQRRHFNTYFYTIEVSSSVITKTSLVQDRVYQTPIKFKSQLNLKCKLIICTFQVNLSVN
jgi:hypothetical protein